MRDIRYKANNLKRHSMIRLLMFFVLVLFGFQNAVCSQAYDLKYNFKNDSVYKYYQETNMVITQTVGDKEQKVINDFKGITDFKFLGYDAENIILGISFETMAIHVENDMFTVDYDSSKPIEGGNLIAQVYQRILGKQFKMIISPYGKVLNVNGIDSIIDIAVNDIPNLNDNSKAQVKAAISGHLGNETLKGNMQLLLGIYPEEKKTVGEQWSTSTTLKSVVKAELNNEWTFLDDKEDAWTFTAKGTISTTGEESQINGMDVNFKLKGNQDSKFVLNQIDGWFEEASQNQTIEGVIVVGNKEQPDSTMEIPMKVLTTTKLQRR